MIVKGGLFRGKNGSRKTSGRKEGESGVEYNQLHCIYIYIYIYISYMYENRKNIPTI
jgi:hypothetical protein